MPEQSKGFESLIRLLDSFEQNSHQDPNLEKDDTGYVTGACVQSIKVNIESIKADLKAKEEQLASLKAVLARKRLSNQRRIDKVKSEWQEKTNEFFIEHQRKEEEMNILYEQTKRDVEKLKRKLEDERAIIHQIVSSRDTMCEKYTYTLEQNYIDTCKKWKVQEKQRLEKVAREKATEMKEEAAKALEPELRNIVENHKKQLVQLKNEDASCISLLKERLTEEYDGNFRLLKQTLEEEQESNFMELEKKFKQQLEDQAKNYETNIENLSASVRAERDDMKKEHLAKMKILTNQHKEELHGWAEQHADLMKAIHLENQNRFESCIATMQSDYDNFKDKMKSELKAWEIEEDNRLELLFHDRIVDETSLIKESMNKEIEVIRAKLKENLETTKLKLRSKLDKDIQDMETKHSSEVKALHTRINEIDEAKTSELFELKVQLQRAKDKLFDIESAAAFRVDALEKSRLDRSMAESEQIKSLEDQLLTITSVEDELEEKKKDIESKIFTNRKILKDELDQRKIEMNTEIATVEKRINMLLKHKESVLLSKRKVLNELVDESKAFEKKIQTMKKRSLC